MQVETGLLRLWIYSSMKKLSEEQEREISRVVTAFIDQWDAHGAKLDAEFKIFDHHFLVFFINEATAQASGCSIDSSVSLIREIESKYNFGLLDRMQVAFLENEGVVMRHYDDLKELYGQGVIGDESKVFNLLLQEGRNFESEWLIPFSKSPYYNSIR